MLYEVITLSETACRKEVGPYFSVEFAAKLRQLKEVSKKIKSRNLIYRLMSNNFSQLIVSILFCLLCLSVNAKTKKHYTVEAITNQGIFSYELENSGKKDVAKELQIIFDELCALQDVSATVSFAPGIYYLDAPISINMAGIKLIGHGHGGIDIHGANLATGTIFSYNFV